MDCYSLRNRMDFEEKYIDTNPRDSYIIDSPGISDAALARNTGFDSLLVAVLQMQMPFYCNFVSQVELI